jgi:signal transduction histidine kinase
MPTSVAWSVMVERREDATARDPAAQPRILIVEDERIVARDLAATLVEFGYAVVDVVARGEDAIARSRVHRPDVILMDIRLAGAMDGIEAAARIRAEHDAAIIFLTAHTDEQTLQRAKHTEPLAYLVKPFRGADLRCAIEIAIHRHEIGARLRERDQWLATTLRAIGDGVVATDGPRAIPVPDPVADGLGGWRPDAALGHALEDIVSLVDEHRRDPLASPIEVRDLNTELERRVVERTAQLEAANTELEAFSYSVAHDLRAPLRGIDGFSQVLIEDHAANLGPEGLAHLVRVRTATKRMARLIDDLLRLGRAAGLDLGRDTFDLSRVARSVAEQLQLADPGRSVELVIRDDLVVEADERLLQVVLENLIGNAWKFTAKAAAGRIEFGMVEQAAGRAYFVRDNGAGFDLARAHKLFGAFQRFHVASEYEGTGVGLALVQRIIHRHGGQIWAESAVGAGATFYFAL